jgi:signal transduction histidine kinase
MVESLRGRLLLLYAATLAIVIFAFGASVAFLTWRARLVDVDAALRTRADAIAAGLVPAESGTFDLELPASPPGVPARVRLYHVVWDARGRLVDRSDPDAPADAPPPVPGARTRAGVREVAVLAASGATVLVGRDLADLRRELWSLIGTIGGTGTAALVLSVAAGWWLIGGALAPIGRISRTAQAMTDGDFSARIPIDRVETELGQVARALNDAFDRLHASLERQRQFTADASHELRTPLTTLSTELQWALARERQPAEYQQSLEAGTRAIARMASIVERLLALARAGGAPAEDERPVPLDDVVGQVTGDLASLASRRGVGIEVERHGTRPAIITANADRLREAVTNVVANAIQYNVEGGRVTIRLTTTGDATELAVADTGVGISAEDVPRVFDPFFRADPARSRDAGGAGLGLAVTRAIVMRSGGTIACVSQPGAGTTITMRWPAA